MCTAIDYTAGDHYFGRNLDLDRSCGETVTITPAVTPSGSAGRGRWRSTTP